MPKVSGLPFKKPHQKNMTKLKHGGAFIEPVDQLPLFRGIASGTPFKKHLENGNWLEYLSKPEPQIGLYFCTLACVTFSALDNIETQMNYYLHEGQFEKEDIDWLTKEGYLKDEFNFSDRYIAKLSGTYERRGNNASNVYETIKEYGLIPEEDWPFPDREMKEKEYYQEIPQELIDKGKRWAERFKIHFNKVHISQWDLALQMSPLQVYVNAWYRNNDGIYYNPNMNFNHAVTKFNREDLIRDQYEPFLKQLTPDYNYYHWGFKYDITKKYYHKPMELKKYDNYLVQLVEGDGGFGLIANEKLYVDDVEKILASWLVRNNGDGAGKTVEFTQAQWDSVDIYNLKDELIYKA